MQVPKVTVSPMLHRWQMSLFAFHQNSLLVYNNFVTVTKAMEQLCRKNWIMSPWHTFAKNAMLWKNGVPVTLGHHDINKNWFFSKWAILWNLQRVYKYQYCNNAVNINLHSWYNIVLMHFQQYQKMMQIRDTVSPECYIVVFPIETV